MQCRVIENLTMTIISLVCLLLLVCLQARNATYDHTDFTMLIKCLEDINKTPLHVLTDLLFLEPSMDLPQIKHPYLHE